MIRLLVQTFALEILRRLQKSYINVLVPRAVEHSHATGKWSIIQVSFLFAVKDPCPSHRGIKCMITEYQVSSLYAHCRLSVLIFIIVSRVIVSRTFLSGLKSGWC